MASCEPKEHSLRPALYFDCAVRIGSRSWPLVSEDGSLGVPDIPRLVNGLYPVCV